VRSIIRHIGEFSQGNACLWWHIEEFYRMTIQELINTLEQFDPTQNVFVALFKNDGTSEIFEIEEITENNGNAQLEIYEEET
jgi:hypothetical protein